MTERDPFEDVLGQFRPAGPRPEMQFPVAPPERGPQRQIRPRWGSWKAAGVLAVVAAGVVGAWIQVDRRSEPQVIGGKPVVGRATPAAGATRDVSAQVPRVTITGDAKRPLKLKDVAPAYPEEARAQKIGGTVLLEIVIATDGAVSEVDIVKGVHPDLDEAAATAVRKWKYVPTKVDDEPVELIMVVDVTFSARE
jgi:TonB family protein